jgi:hypothetical protein
MRDAQDRRHILDLSKNVETDVEGRFEVQGFVGRRYVLTAVSAGKRSEAIEVEASGSPQAVTLIVPRQSFKN